MRSGSLRDSDCRGENRRSAEPELSGVNVRGLIEWYRLDGPFTRLVTGVFP